MNQSLVKVQENCFEVGVFLGQFEFFTRVGDLKAATPAQHLDVLIEMLPIQTHEVGRLMFL